MSKTQEIFRIYLHWAATNYTWKEPGHYHCVVTGDGVAHHLTPFDQHLGAHTFARNSNSVAFSLACMGEKGWDSYPPTVRQIDTMCREVAVLAKSLGWSRDKLDLKHIMTHAEAAANRDYPKDLVVNCGQLDNVAVRHGLPHGNYGPMSWPDGWPGGSAERWDLAQLQRTDTFGSGGPKLRAKILQAYDAL